MGSSKYRRPQARCHRVPNGQVGPGLLAIQLRDLHWRQGPLSPILGAAATARPPRAALKWSSPGACRVREQGGGGAQGSGRDLQFPGGGAGPAGCGWLEARPPELAAAPATCVSQGGAAQAPRTRRTQQRRTRRSFFAYNYSDGIIFFETNCP